VLRSTRVPCILWIAILCSLPVSFAKAVPPSVQLLPNTTKGFVSVPDMNTLQASWDKTQWGKLFADPMMKPFADDLKRQISGRLSKAGVQFGITWEDLQRVYGGEVALGMVQPGDANSHAMVLIVDISGHAKQTDALLAKIAKAMKARNAKDDSWKEKRTEITGYIYTPANAKKPRHAYYFVRNRRLVASDHKEVLRGILAHMHGRRVDSLASNPVYRRVTAELSKTPNATPPHLHWFVEPFGYFEVVRAATGGRRKRGTDILKVLTHQGFRAIEGAGGKVTLASDGMELLHQSFIYAPKEKFKLAARMLDMGERRCLKPDAWVPQDVATYFSFGLKIQPAFRYSETLVNELAGDKDGGLFQDVLNSLRDDPNGPQIDIREDIVKNMGSRVSVVTNYKTPITPQSERGVFAIKLIDHTAHVAADFDRLDKNKDGKITAAEHPVKRRRYFRRVLREFGQPPNGGLTKKQYIKSRSVQAAINRSMEKDQEAKRRKVGKHIIWEIINKPKDKGNEEEIPIIKIEGPGFGAVSGADEEEEEVAVQGKAKGKRLPNSAIAVVHGHLLIATHVDFLVKVLERTEASPQLSQSNDFRYIMARLNKLGASDKENGLAFSRTDKEYQSTYELLRQGKMPESKAMFGQALNALLGPEDEDKLREQQIDGRKLPEYKLVRPYLGPAGLYIRTIQEPSASDPQQLSPVGWLVIGCTVNKKAALEAPTLPSSNKTVNYRGNPADELNSRQARRIEKRLRRNRR